MHESGCKVPHQANHSGEHLRPEGTIVPPAHQRALHHIKRHLCNFGRAVCGRWPSKPAAHLAHVAHISERNANQLITGERETISAEVMHAFEGELFD